MLEMKEPKGRRTREQIDLLVHEAKRHIDDGMGKVEAAKKVGLNYPTLSKYLGNAKTVSGDTDKVIFQELKRIIEIIKDQVRKEIRSKI